MSRSVLGFVVGFTVSLAGTSFGADGEDTMPTISVTGTGKIGAAPDVAEINVGVVTQGVTAQEALSANSEAMNKIHDLLKERGLAAKDIRTTQIQVSPYYSQPPPHRPGDEQKEFVPRIAGYRVDNTVQITERQVARLGALLDALVGAGANQIHGISFRIDQPDELIDKARVRAIADARRKAAIYAEEAGVALGRPRRIEEVNTSIPRPPIFGRAMMAAAASPTPIAPGEQELSISVHVVYEMKVPK